MSEELEKLQELGAQKISEDTHIPIKHVQAILHSSFEGFSKVQFIGFISIIEREYSLDLKDIRESGEEFFIEKNISGTDSSLFVSENNQQKNSKVIFYALLVFVLFIIAIGLNYTSSSESPQSVHKVDNTIINSIKEDVVIEKNTTNSENNITTAESENNTTVEENLDKSFEIVAKSKVWFGYIDVQTHKHYQKTFTGSIDLDPDKEWLLLFGHGYINMFINSKARKFKTYNNLRFLYKDGELTAISKEEFKKLNRGHSW